jgi:tyrosine-protein kinase Etk/Wzc
MASIEYPRFNESSTDDEVHFSEYLAVIAEGWRLIVSIAFGVLLLGALYAFLAKPIYRADALIQVEDSANSTKDALGELATIFDTKQTADAEIELIRSRLVVGQTVQRLHLDIGAQPRYFPVVGALIARFSGSDRLASPLLGLRQFAWGGEKIEVTVFDVPAKQYDASYTLVALGDGRYDLMDPSGVRVLSGHVGETVKAASVDGPIELRVVRLVARAGTHFRLTRASTLATIADLQDALVIAEKTKQSGIIGVSLDGADSKRTAEIINTIAAAYVQQNIDRKSAEAEHTLAFLDQQLPQLRKQLDDAEDRYNAFRNRKGTVDLSEEGRLILQQVVDSKTKEQDLVQQRAELAQRFSPTHPALTSLDAQIAALREQQNRLEQRVASLPDTEQSALRLLRDVRVDTELYTNLLDSAQQLRIVKAGEVGNVRVVDYSVASDVPIRPKRALVIALALLMGSFIGVTTAFIKRALFGGIEHSEQIEQALGLPVYATVPHSKTEARLRDDARLEGKSPRVLASVASDDVAVEGIRSLRTALHFGLVNASNNVLVITGPRPNIGKSFTAVNLSVVLASGGQRVLLVDGDMRRGDLHEQFRISRQPGLADVIAGLNADDAIVREVSPGVDLLPRGAQPPDPAELLMSERFRTLVSDLSSRYDLVLFDTPPVLAVTDAALIGKWAGATFMVVRHGVHPAAEIVETSTRLRNGGVTLKGVLLTDVPQRRIGYGAYYASYYRYEST